MKKIFLAMIILAFFLAWFMLLGKLLVKEKEDAWVCEDGRWVMYGLPSDPMPEWDCF